MAIQMGKDADAAAGSSPTSGTPGAVEAAAAPSRPGSPSLVVSAPHHPHDRSAEHPHDRSAEHPHARFDEVGGLVARLSTHFDGDEEWIEVEVTEGAEQWTVDVHWRKASTNMMGVRRLVVVKGHRVMVTEGLSSFFEPEESPAETRCDLGAVELTRERDALRATLAEVARLLGLPEGHEDQVVRVLTDVRAGAEELSDLLDRRDDEDHADAVRRIIGERDDARSYGPIARIAALCDAHAIAQIAALCDAHGGETALDAVRRVLDRLDSVGRERNEARAAEKTLHALLTVATRERDALAALVPEPPADRPLPADLLSPGTFLERLRRRAIGRDWWRVREWMFKQLDAGGGAIDRNELAARAHGYFSGRGGTPIPHAYRLAADLVIEEWQAGGAVAQEGVPDDPVEATIGDSEGMPTTIDHVLRTHRGELTVSVRFDPIRREGHPAFTAYSAERGGRGDGHSVVEALGRLAAHLVNEAHANLGALTGEERTR